MFLSLVTRNHLDGTETSAAAVLLYRAYCADHLPVHVRRRNDLEDANSECIWIECLLNNSKLLFAVYYRPPGQLAADRDIFLSSLASSIELAQDSGADSIVVTGDFNDRCKLWGDNHESSELRCLLRDLV